MGHVVAVVALRVAAVQAVAGSVEKDRENTRHYCSGVFSFHTFKRERINLHLRLASCF